MYLLVDGGTDPTWNLAAEEYLLSRRSEPFFRLWRNADSVIIGRHQNAWAEIDLDFVERNHIPVVRRMTGGGAVFHDLGNVNYSFFDLKDRRFTDVILEALRALGIEGQASGRNDLILADGRKFSGTAVCKRGNRLLEHGTLLFDASFDRLSAALRPRPEKFEGKAVKSVRSRVTNLAQQLPEPISVEAFIDFLADAIGTQLHRGVTMMNVVGAYSGLEHTMLLCACSNSEGYRVKKLVYSIDPKALIMISPNDEVFGEGFKSPED